MFAQLALRDGLIVGHLVVMAVWFGTDIATFSLSRRVVDADLPVESRLVLAKAMVGIEIAARLCLPTMLALGLSLSIEGGYLSFGDSPMTDGTRSALLFVIWLVVAAWVVLVWTIHRTGGELAGSLAKGDLMFRTLVCLALWISGLASLASHDGPFIGNWLIAKVLLFALIMTCGIVIRFLLTPFSAAFGQIAASGSSPDQEAILVRAIRRAQPLVGIIWLSILCSIALGALQVTLLA